MKTVYTDSDRQKIMEKIAKRISRGESKVDAARAEGISHYTYMNWKQQYNNNEQGLKRAKCASQLSRWINEAKNVDDEFLNSVCK